MTHIASSSTAGGRHMRRGAAPRGWSGKPSKALKAQLAAATGSPVFLLTALLLAASLLLGGASRENALQLGVLELLSLPLLPVALWRLVSSGELRKVAIPLAVLTGIFVIGLLQLVPLPFGLWRAAPGHEVVATGLQLAGAAPSSLPLSLTPALTRNSLLALLIPTAMLLGASACSTEERRLLTALLIGAAAGSLVLSVLQIAGGPDSPLRFYPTTNRREAVGVFANRNHLAAYLIATLPMMTVWIRDFAGDRARRAGAVAIPALAMFAAVLVGVAITESRTGILLSAPAVLGSLLLLWRGDGRGRSAAPVLGLGFVALLAGATVALFEMEGIVHRFTPALENDYRATIWPSVIEAAMRFSPFGAGLGSLESVYRLVERVDLMSAAFVNHAHNDYLEVWLEAGWAGVALLVVMLGWVGARACRAWLRPSGRASELARAASVALLLLAAHSMVDYPLRTPAMAAVAALMCACLAKQGSEVSQRGMKGTGRSAPSR